MSIMTLYFKSPILSYSGIHFVRLHLFHTLVKSSRKQFSTQIIVRLFLFTVVFIIMENPRTSDVHNRPNATSSIPDHFPFTLLLENNNVASSLHEVIWVTSPILHGIYCSIDHRTLLSSLKVTRKLVANEAKVVCFPVKQATEHIFISSFLALLSPPLES